MEVFASDFNDGSFDNCTSGTGLSFSAEIGPASSTPPVAGTLTIGLGQYQITMWVVDEAGNANHCTSTLTFEDCPGTMNLACNDNIEIDILPNQSLDFYPSDMLEGGPYCYSDMNIANVPLGTPAPYLTYTEADAGIHTLRVQHLPSGNICWGTLVINGGCTNDVTAPVAVCNQSIEAQLSVNGPDLTILDALTFDDGSFDNCTAAGNLQFAVEIAAVPSATMPTSTSVSFTAVGVYQNLFLWIADESGNTNTCGVTVVIVPPKCNPDNTDPYFTYVPLDTVIHSDDLAAMNLDPQDFLQLNEYFGEAQVWDYCGLDTVLQSIDFITNSCNAVQTITRYFWAVDEAGNSSAAQQTITVKFDYSINLPADFHPDDAGQPDTLSFMAENGTLLSVSYDDVVFDYNCDDQPDLIHRTWSVADFCSTDLNAPAFELPRLDLDNNGQVGDAYVAWHSEGVVYLLENGLPVQTLGSTTAVLAYTQIIRYNYYDTISYAVEGTVFQDNDANCNLNANEPGLVGWAVKAIGNVTGQVYTTSTSANGIYQINDICASDTELEISLDVPFNYGQGCSTTWTVQTINNMTAVQHIPVQLNTECALMVVDLGTPFLRRCFANNYTVSYCNYSAEVIEGAYVEVHLDTFMEYTGSSITGTLVSGNTYSFQVGDLAAGQCENFIIDFDLSCEAELGQTHCTEAHIYPDTLCPQNANWTGANIEVEGECVNNAVLLKITNTGAGDMTAPLEYIVVEDVLMFDQGSFNLLAGQSMQLQAIQANGATWRLEAEQAPLHPYPGSVAVAIEGCNGINELGLVNLFPLENPNPFIAVDCQENQGSFDPNDKQGFPVGYGEEHFIYRNTDIEYLIRFQNTGTDTAFTVVIVDTLSQYLDETSIRPGASSHPYSFEVIGGHTLRFTFNDIILPDSNINLAASQGFVRFIAKQKTDVALGSIIENTAAIYFDFNEPVITNRVFHTIGENFIEVINDATDSNNAIGLPTVFPNPSFGSVTFALPLELGEKASFQLHDSHGKLAWKQAVSSKQFVFERKNLQPGIYFYTIENEGVKLFSGKVVLK